MTSTQAPLNSGFGPRTTARDVLNGQDLSGKLAIVTGGYSGLGLATTRALSEAGASVIVPARSPEKARDRLRGIAGVELAELDLVDPASIDRFGQAFIQSNRPLHILANCAGIMASPLSRDARGFESQFATNHLGHFQLTLRLLPALFKAGGARVVSVSSRGHRIAGVDFEDPNFERREYQKWKAYGQSKTANVLFAVGLDKRVESRGVRAFSLHPGMIPTDLSRHLPNEEMLALGFRDEKGGIPFDKRDNFKTAEQGAATIVWCAASPQLNGHGGVYCEDVDIAEAVPADAKQDPGVRLWAIDPELAERLWDLSEKMTATRFAV